MNALVRGPRSGSGTAPKLSPVHRGTPPGEWELSHWTNKEPAAVGVNHHKRSLSTRSSSPPVSHWESQRPQKISCSSRMTNLVPIVSSIINGASASDATSDAITANGVRSVLSSHLSGSSPQRMKIKGEPLSPAALSESEESDAPEIKLTEKCQKSDGIKEKGRQYVQKESTLIQPTRKNKLATGEDLGESIQKKGKGGTPTICPVTPAAEKLGNNVGTAKQLRGGKCGPRNLRKSGRPPTRKLSDRKAYKHQKFMAPNTVTGLIDDGLEEQLAAVHAVANPTYALSGSTWRNLEPVFRIITDLDIAHLEQQVEFLEEALPCALNLSSISSVNVVTNSKGLINSDIEAGPASETMDITLCQTLISALISEEDYPSGTDELEFDACDSDMVGEWQAGSLNHLGDIQIDTDEYENGTGGEWQVNAINHLDDNQFAGGTLNSYKILGKPECGEAELNTLDATITGVNSKFDYSLNGQSSYQAPVSDLEYNCMNLEERLHLEVQSIGILPHIVPEKMQAMPEGIFHEINKFEEGHGGQISKKKVLIKRLLKSITETKPLEEKEFDQRVYDKLVAMAYQKNMTCRYPKSKAMVAKRMAKQAALAFVQRTLDCCRKFEDTRKSFLSEPWFKDILLSRQSQLSSVQSTMTPRDSKLRKRYTNTSTRLPQASRFSQDEDRCINFSALVPPLNLVSGQNSTKEDLWSNKMIKKEILLDDAIVFSPPASSRAPSISLRKGKTSGRDREGKGYTRKVLFRKGDNKTCRPKLSNSTMERKAKTKPKQKIAQLCDSESKSTEMNLSSSSNTKGKSSLGPDLLYDAENIDLSALQLPGIDILCVPDDFGGQGEDVGSWLNINDDGLQDNDLMGLKIPMDDLSDVNMMV